ncbi:hypothetical protein [Vibrio cyclitrophicus]|uniref:hypothetical protein n=1 Tax=Vibrio cyclitrophicus TaxID=47951 RepID=UPI000C82A6CA|nr:hypothetical protein [Vibrio cyclitrophicus]PME27489.1 hypothetical protein BCV41_00925 [Vibrio cyclitrophicus]
MTNDLIEILYERFEAAGFKAVEGNKLLLGNNENWPEPALENQLFYCFSDFASILVVDISSDNSVEALELTKRSETYLDAALIEREKNGSVIDGYLVLATTKINDDLKSFITNIERDTRFVRKHVVFLGDDGWERYQRITPLGLVSPFKDTQLEEFVPDSTESYQLLESLAEFGSTPLARLHKQKWDLNE